MSARSAIRRVRRALQESLPAVTARAVLFHALSQWGPQIPESHEELVRFVRGPLKRVISAHLPSERWVPIIVRIENALAVVDSTDEQDPSPRPSSHPPALDDPQDTRQLRAVDMPARVLVLAAGSHFANTLQLTLGPEEVTTTGAHSLEELRAALAYETELVVVDGSDPPITEATRLAAALDGLPPHSLAAIWGANHPFGRDVIHAMEAVGVHCVPFVISEGIAPLLDLVRSRRTQ